MRRSAAELCSVMLGLALVAAPSVARAQLTTAVSTSSSIAASRSPDAVAGSQPNPFTANGTYTCTIATATTKSLYVQLTTPAAGAAPAGATYQITAFTPPTGYSLATALPITLTPGAAATLVVSSIAGGVGGFNCGTNAVTYRVNTTTATPKNASAYSMVVTFSLQ